jgi:hypothetical protein
VPLPVPTEERRMFIAEIAINSKLLMQLLAAIFPAIIAPTAESSAARFDGKNDRSRHD